MTAHELWEQFAHKRNMENVKYEAWQFGGVPDELADLVVKGIKTATASLYFWYRDGSERLPAAGDYSVILNTADEAVCIIKNTRVYIAPYREVTKEHAYKEGEGDRSLAYWRRVHKHFFSEELKSADMEFSEDVEVVCEEFELVYTA